MSEDLLDAVAKLLAKRILRATDVRIKADDFGTRPIAREILAIVDETAADEINRLRAALERQTDSMAFILNHATLPEQWADKFARELEDDRAALATISKDPNA